VDGQNAVLSFDWSGQPLGQTVLGAERKGKSPNGSGCNPSPAVDAQGLFVYFKSGELAGLDLDGKLRWKINLQEQYGKDDLYWDLGTSPMLTKRDVVVAVMQHGGSFLAAFDQLTGAPRWKVARDYETPVECDHSYATPLLCREGGREELIVWGAQHLTAHNADDGKLVWWCAGFNPEAKNNWVVVASPVLAGGMVVVPYGRGSLLYGIKMGGSGDVTATHRAWERDDTGCFVPTPAEYQGRVYLLRDRGEVVCVDPATGRTLWSGELPKGSASYYASPTLADGKIYAAREDGVVFVARVGGHFEVLARNEMGERIIAAPVPVSGRLLIRGEKHLFCAGGQGTGMVR
jgi:outer membrane protein assembly factor BamB